MCTRKCSECSKQSAKIYQTHHYGVRAECAPLVSASDSTTEYCVQLRRESVGRRHEGSKSLRSTSIMTKPADSNTKQSTFIELAEQLRNFHESANALAVCLHTGDTTSKTDPNLIEAAKHLYHKLLRKASDDQERVPPQPCESSLAEVTRDRRRCPRTATSNETSCPRAEAPSKRPCSPAGTLVEKPCSRPETASEVSRSLTETISPSREPLEQVAGGHFRKQFELTVPLCRSGEWKYEFKTSKLSTTMLNLLFSEAEQKGKTRNFRGVHWAWV